MKDRNPYDLTKVKEDRCDPRLQYLLNLINSYFKNNIHIFFFSGREGTEQCYTDTFEWLSKFVIVEWPEIQSYIDKEGFDNNCCLINDDTWLDQYGALSYFVNEEWKHKIDEKIYSQSYHKL